MVAAHLSEKAWRESVRPGARTARGGGGLPGPGRTCGHAFRALVTLGTRGMYHAMQNCSAASQVARGNFF